MVLKVLNDVYKQKVIEDEIHEVLVKRDVMTRKDINLEDISTVSEVYNANGRIYKTRCVISIKDGSQFFLKHRFDDIINMKKPIRVNGFRGK